jgi:hypothetical protein
MSANLKSVGMLFVLVCSAIVPTTGNASGITAEIARSCNALTAKAFPPRQVGNPAAGSAQGSGHDQRAYFNNCVANQTNATSDTGKKAK